MTSQNNALSKLELEVGTILSPAFNADGLVTAVVQDHDSGEILMLAHMNAEALDKTIETRKAYFWSRSRQSLWLKGETSGNFLVVKDLLIDCDQDAIVVKAKLTGDSACHTGVRSCFYRSILSGSEGPSLIHHDNQE